MSEHHERFKNYADGARSVVVAACAVLTLIWGYYQFTTLLSKQTAKTDYQNKLLTNQLGVIELQEKKPVIDIEVAATPLCVPELDRDVIFIDALVKNVGALTATIDIKGITDSKNKDTIYPFRIGAYTPKHDKDEDGYTYIESIPVKSVGRDLWAYTISPNGYKHLYALADVKKTGTYFIDFEAPASQSLGQGKESDSGNYYGDALVVFHSKQRCSHV